MIRSKNWHGQAGYALLLGRRRGLFDSTMPDFTRSISFFLIKYLYMEICKYCSRELKNKQALKAHEFRCKLNPDYENNKKIYADTMEKFLNGARRSKKDVYFDYTSKCQKCGKEFTQRTTKTIIQRNKQKKCCCRACSNSRNHSEETRRKTSNSLNKFHEKMGTSRQSDNPEHRKNCSGGSLRGAGNRSKDIREHKCVFCEKTIYAKFYRGVYCYECAEKNGLDNLQLYDENGKMIPSKQRIEAGKKVQQRLIDEGRHKGWQSRNIISYPEKFWMEVLKNNNIDFSFNHVVNKKTHLGLDDNSNYFLDFLINGNIDLEIDGKQHKYEERSKSDRIRDEILTKNDYIVYRVQWNEINSEDGKKLMKQKIDNFLDFYKFQISSK